jgi:hypothetical protein
LLEKAAEANYLKNVAKIAKTKSGKAATRCVEAPKVGLCRPFAERQTGDGWAPLLLLNGTSVATGRRVIASELQPIWMYEDNEGRKRPQALHQSAYNLFDILDASCGETERQAGTCASTAQANAQPKVNLRLSTAAVLSARFPIISPAASIRMNTEGVAHGDKVVDGGYFENSGLTTALDVAAALKKVGLTPVVVSISNDPSPQSAEVARTAQLDCSKADEEPVQAASTMHLNVGPSEDSPWVKGLDILAAPILALYHTRDGHADEAGRTLTQSLAGWNTPHCDRKHPYQSDSYASFFPIRIYTRVDNIQMPEVSMSWWLSPVVRRALEKQIRDATANTMQLDLLMARLRKAGCPDCSHAKVGLTLTKD